LNKKRNKKAPAGNRGLKEYKMLEYLKRTKKDKNKN